MKNARKFLILALLTVLSALVFTACSKVDFKVNFVVDGELYSTISTNGAEVIKMPESPTKDGYEFAGWFWDEGAWKKPFTANSLLDAPLTDNMSVYAKFEKIGTTALTTPPIPGTAYKMFLDQENAGVRCFATGVIDGYYLGVSTNLDDAANVYVEESSMSGKYYLFFVKDGTRKYVNIELVNGYYNAVLSNIGVTAYAFDSRLKTMVASVDGNSLLLGTNSANEYKRIGTRYTYEASFVAHLTASTNPDTEIPDATVIDSDIGGIISGGLGNYNTAGVVVAVNAQSFLLSDGTGEILVYRGSAWTPDVKVGDSVKLSGKTTTYGGAMQFSAPTEWSFTSVDSGYTHPTPKELTAAELDAYSTIGTVTPVYVKIVGTLTISGYYYNIDIDGASITGSITYPVGDLSVFNGKTVTVIGYITGVTGNGQYLNIIITSIS